MTATLDNWMFSDEEMEAAYGAQENTDESAPSLENQAQAERHLRSLGYWQAELNAQEAHYLEQKALIDHWWEAEKKKIENRMKWHERGLSAFLLNSGKASLKLIYGTLRLNRGRESVKVHDSEAVIRWAMAVGSEERREMVAIKHSPKLREILAHVHATGELPDGCEVERGMDSVSVTLNIASTT